VLAHEDPRQVSVSKSRIAAITSDARSLMAVAVAKSKKLKAKPRKRTQSKEVLA
jgi:hypothetical protein